MGKTRRCTNQTDCHVNKTQHKHTDGTRHLWKKYHCFNDLLFQQKNLLWNIPLILFTYYHLCCRAKNPSLLCDVTEDFWETPDCRSCDWTASEHCGSISEYVPPQSLRDAFDPVLRKDSIQIITPLLVKSLHFCIRLKGPYFWIQVLSQIVWFEVSGLSLEAWISETSTYPTNPNPRVWF